MFEDVRAAPAVLSFLWDTRVGGMVPLALRERWAGDDDREADRVGEEGGRARPRNALFLCLPFVIFSLVRTFSGAVSFVLSFAVLGALQ